MMKNVIQVLKVFKVIADQIGGMDLIKDAISGDDNNTNHYNKHKLSMYELGYTMKAGGLMEQVIL